MNLWLIRLALISALVQIASGQQTSTSLPQSPGQTKQAQQEEKSERMLGVLPQFGVTNQKNPSPLTPKQKFQLFYRSALDPVEFGVVGLEAGISQAENSFSAYGQGASGYGKRYAAGFTDQVSGNFFGNFIYPVLLKQDPRYFRKGEGPIKRRVVYALAQEFVGHKDGGARTFNWPSTLGLLTAGGISNAYYPERDRGFGLTMSRAGISLLYGSLGQLGSEFWPDIARKLRRHKDKSVPGDQSQKKQERKQKSCPGIGTHEFVGGGPGEHQNIKYRNQSLWPQQPCQSER
jgi:hypothetical protein